MIHKLDSDFVEQGLDRVVHVGVHGATGYPLDRSWRNRPASADAAERPEIVAPAAAEGRLRCRRSGPVAVTTCEQACYTIRPSGRRLLHGKCPYLAAHRLRDLFVTLL